MVRLFEFLRVRYATVGSEESVGIYIIRHQIQYEGGFVVWYGRGYGDWHIGPA